APAQRMPEPATSTQLRCHSATCGWLARDRVYSQKDVPQSRGRPASEAGTAGWIEADATNRVPSAALAGPKALPAGRGLNRSRWPDAGSRLETVLGHGLISDPRRTSADEN